MPILSTLSYHQNEICRLQWCRRVVSWQNGSNQTKIAVKKDCWNLNPQTIGQQTTWNIFFWVFQWIPNVPKSVRCIILYHSNILTVLLTSIFGPLRKIDAKQKQAWISAPLKLIPNLDWPLEMSGYRTPWWKGDLGASPFEGWVSYSTVINSKFYFLAWDWWFAITFIAFGLYPRHETHDSNCSSRSILEHIESHEIMLCFVSQKPFHTSRHFKVAIPTSCWWIWPQISKNMLELILVIPKS